MPSLPWLYPYSGKLSREKMFTNFTVLEPPAKVFSSKFGSAISTYVRFLHSAKWSHLPDPRKFSPLKVSRYTVPSSKLMGENTASS